MTDGPPSLTVELYVRSLAPDGTRLAVESVVERLQRLEAGDAIANFTVHVTGKKVCPHSPTARIEPGTFLLDRVASFEAWADRTGRSVSGAFRRIEDAEGIDGSDHSGVAFPTMAMAEYEDGDLRFVSPAARDRPSTLFRTDSTSLKTLRPRLVLTPPADRSTDRRQLYVTGNVPTARNRRFTIYATY